MRNLIFALLVLNVGYLIWSVAFSSSYTPPPSTVEGIPSLTLLPFDEKAFAQLNTKKTKTKCFTLGPFNTRKTAQLLSNKINGVGLSSDIHSQKTKETLNFLVYLQALSTRKEAEKVVKKLRENEVKNYTIIESGPYKNAIALGSFENLDKARRHSEYIRYMGFDSRFTEQRKPREVYWISYDESFGTETPVFEWLNKIDPSTSVQRIPSECKF